MVIGLPNAPACPAVSAKAETREEAIINIKDAIEGCIAVLEEDGLPVPEERFETLVVVI